MSAPNGAFAQDATLDVGGRVMIDYTIADFDTPDSSIRDSEVRRARLFASGTYGSSVKYKFEFNHATGGGLELTDGYVQFAPQDSQFKFKVGHFKTHNSLEEETSSRFISTIERGAFTDAFELNRRAGVSINMTGDNYGVDVGAFGTNVETEGGPDEGFAFAGRGYYNPIKSDDTIVHLGASWRYREQGDSQSDLRYRQRPYTHVAPDRIINTGRFAESDNFYGAEIAVIRDNIWAAGEYALLRANGSNANEDAEFSGGYMEVGIMFGGNRTYKSGKFNRPKVDKPIGESGMGALALVARYDTIDLQDGPYLGQLNTIVLGADWWATKQTRFALNYFNVDSENGSTKSGSGIVGRLSFDF
ncbi:OprO/OprP family phosphate-selective porin [Algimonas arctica]|nr:porin [Algimonas arctica]